jgi:hypothetical protein
MVIQLIVPVAPAAQAAFPAELPGKHRILRGTTCRETGQIQAATPAQFKAKVLIRALGGDLAPRTRRAR